MDIWKQAVEIVKDSNCKKRLVACIITTTEGVYVSHGVNYHENGICDCIPGPGTAQHAEIAAINNIPVYDRGLDLVAHITHKPCNRCRSILDAVCVEVKVNELSERLEPNMDEPGIKNDLLKERASTHGDFKESSRFVQAVKAAMQVTPNWKELETDQQESLHMIQHKVGRILYGQPHVVDHWTDISGYAQLIEERLNGLH